MARCFLFWFANGKCQLKRIIYHNFLCFLVGLHQMSWLDKRQKEQAILRKNTQPTKTKKESNRCVCKRNVWVKSAKRKSTCHGSLYTRAKCKLSNLIKHAKRCFFQEIIDKNKGNPKGIWKALKTLGGVKKDQVTSRQLITEHGAITDKQEIAEYMNDAFINTASKIIPGSQCVADLNLDDVALYEFVKSKSVLWNTTYYWGADAWSH